MDQRIDIHVRGDSVELHQETVCGNCGHKDTMIIPITTEDRVVSTTLHFEETERRVILRDDDGRAVGSVGYKPSSLAALDVGE